MDRPLQIAIIGAGSMGWRHAEAYTAIPETRVAGIVSSTSAKAAEMGAHYHAKPYSNLEMLLAEQPIDIVDICTPTNTHADIAEKAMRMGKHVLCEKPVALDVQLAERMVQCAIDNQVRLMVAQVLRFWPEYVYLKEMVKSYEMGSLLQLWMSRIGSIPGWSTSNWFLDESRSGLAPIDLHIHDADFIHHLLGKPAAVHSMMLHPPEHTASYIKTRYFYPDIPLVEAEGGWYTSSIRFSANFRAVFSAGVLQTQADGLWVYPAGHDGFRVDFEDELLHGCLRGQLPGLDAYFNEIKYFVDNILAGTPFDLVPLQDTIQVLACLHSEIESARMGKPITL